MYSDLTYVFDFYLYRSFNSSKVIGFDYNNELDTKVTINQKAIKKAIHEARKKAKIIDESINIEMLIELLYKIPEQHTDRLTDIFNQQIEEQEFKNVTT